jgi:hypothetical protein
MFIPTLPYTDNTPDGRVQPASMSIIMPTVRVASTQCVGLRVILGVRLRR